MKHLSVNQLVSETRKAMVGKGYGFGVADDVARALEWLAGFHIVPSDELRALMQAPCEGPPVAPHIDVNRLIIAQAGIHDMLAGLDFAEAHEVQFLQLLSPLYPLISLGLLALRASPPVGQFLPKDGASLSSLCTDISDHGKSDDEIGLAYHSYHKDSPAHWPARISIDESCYEMLKQMAFETYVPSSEQSRAAGAGAGLNDND